MVMFILVNVGQNRVSRSFVTFVKVIYEYVETQDIWISASVFCMHNVSKLQGTLVSSSMSLIIRN